MIPIRPLLVHCRLCPLHLLVLPLRSSPALAPGFARGFRSLFGWPQHNAAPALPPLTASGLRGLHEDGDQDGGVHRLAVTSPGLTQANEI